MKALSLYVHVPFCTRRCSYCAFYHTSRSDDLEDGFLDAVETEIEASLGTADPPVVLRTVFIGGGTPSSLSPNGWDRLWRAISPFRRDDVTVEVTCEVNPEDVDEPLLERLERSGVDRVSLGIQSMDAAAQRVLKRCSPEINRRAAERVTRRFSNVSFDVLLGVPGVSRDAIHETMSELAEWSPAHFSVYCLEPGGDMADDVAAFFDRVDDDRAAEEYLFVCEELDRLGYHHYEVSNFARPGRESAHNRCYWEGGEYVGVGPGAHSLVGGSRFHNAPSLERYLALPQNGVRSARIVDDPPADPEIEPLMLLLRTSRGVPLERARCSRAVIDGIVKEGFARIDRGRLVLTDRGFLMMNDILIRLAA